jgi:hypothetical protein
MSSLLMFHKVYRLEICTVSHVGIFDPSCEIAPLYLLSSSPPPLSCVNKYRSIVYSLYRGGDRGGSGCVESIYRCYTMCIWPDTKLLYLPRGPKTNNHLPAGPLAGQFLRKPTFRVWCLHSYLVHGSCATLILQGDVNGENEQPIFTWLKRHLPVPQGGGYAVEVRHTQKT